MKLTRPMTPEDFDWVLALNRVYEKELSPMGVDKLSRLYGTAYLAEVADPEAGFLLTFDQGSDYDSPNFLWFKQRLDRFAYVDRIAIDAAHRRKGLAEALYAAFFAKARADGHTQACCEVNADPPNPGSDRFHAALGFEVMGEAHLDDLGKSVRYFVKDLSGG